MHKSLAVFAATTVAASVLTLSTTTPADAAARHFKSCDGMHKVYPHGVGRSDAVDHTSGTRVKNFYHNTTLYKANNGPRNAGTGEYDLDRDNDGIACEKL
jgi:hypothetical protein